MSSEADLSVPPFLEPQVYNFGEELKSLGTWMVCLVFGGWGLFWLNDNGEAMEKCFKLFGGTLPVYDQPPSA